MNCPTDAPVDTRYLSIEQEKFFNYFPFPLPSSRDYQRNCLFFKQMLLYAEEWVCLPNVFGKLFASRQIKHKIKI